MKNEEQKVGDSSHEISTEGKPFPNAAKKRREIKQITKMAEALAESKPFRIRFGLSEYSYILFLPELS